jgi:MFS transporter, DHA1 family, multidrug resistance protein
MMGELNFTSLQLGLYFAVTVLIVFAAGFLAPRLAQRWSQQVIGLLGILIALAGSIFLFAFASALLGFMQMGCAAFGASRASILPLPPSTSLAVILTTGSGIALMVFLPVARRQPE